MKTAKKKRTSMLGKGGPEKKKRQMKTTPLTDMLNTISEATTIKTEKTGAARETEQKLAGKPSLATVKLTFNIDKSECPTARWGHSLCMVSEKEAVLIGGQGEGQQFCKDSIWRLNLERGVWRVMQTTGVVTGSAKPDMRMGHTAVYDPTVRCIYVFGGSKKLKWFNDIHVLDVDDGTWQLIKANGKAPQRAYHSCTLYRHELWVFGGVYPRPDPHPDGCSNDVHVFNPMEEGWYTPIVMGDAPSPRSGHSATLLGDRLILFGGWDAPICFNDFHMLDLTLIEWSTLKVLGAIPSPRSWHASCALSGNRVLIHGGYNGHDALHDSFVFNYDSMSCTLVKMVDCGQARTGHTILCMPYKHENNETDDVLVFGGGDNNDNFFQDLTRLKIPFETAL